MLRGDGRLSLDPGHLERAPQEECGVFGVWAPGEAVSKLTYFGLYALQHRGQEAAGIAISNGEQIRVYKDIGLVSQVFDEATLATLTGHLAIGHTRYSTTGSSTWQNAQPTLGATAFGTMALAHNGNLTNTAALANRVRDPHPRRPRPATFQSTTDTSLLTALFGQSEADDLVGAAIEVLPELVGAFSLVFMDESRLCAARDPLGVRPLVLGRLGASVDADAGPTGWVVASETAALDIVGASFEREVAPGELLVIDESGVRSHRFAAPRPRGCVFEYVYLARPDTTIAGRGVHAARLEIGRQLAREAPAVADLVIPVPESGTPAAVGYASESGIPFGMGLVKNAYVGRTFIQPSQTIRQLGIRLKLNPLRDVIAGRRLVVVDDSIVRGNTQRALIAMLRDAGAAEVHVRISSPPVRWPCFLGIDFASRAELAATDRTVAEVCESIGADSLGFVSLDGLVAATNQAPERLCLACFNGDYPVAPPQSGARAKLVLEQGRLTLGG